LIVDFHSHSTASDGELSPADLLLRARQNGVQLMAITDHDSIDGYLAVREQPADSNMQLVCGVELSCVWAGRLIHIVGLNIDPDNLLLLAGLETQQQARLERAHLIGSKLEKYGFMGGYDYAAALAGDSQIGRPHFARFLLECGHVGSINEAFKKYLGAGKSGDIKLTWPALATVVEWITGSGGVAVIAHPLHYKMTATKLRLLIADFKQEGGKGIEVISGKQAADRTQYLAQLSCQFELLASVGSDFHKPGMPWSELGQAGTLPPNCRPVWSAWQS
jgi:3',5'-nucleoside bisphosphate phosphatase